MSESDRSSEAWAVYYAGCLGRMEAEMACVEIALRVALDVHVTLDGLRESIRTTLESVQQHIEDQRARDRERLGYRDVTPAIARGNREAA